MQRMVSMRRACGSWRKGRPLFEMGGEALREDSLNAFIASACKAAGQKIASLICFEV